MGLFDLLESQAKASLSKLGIGAHGNLVNELAQLVGGEDSSGLQSLLTKFQDKGLEAAVASWIGVRANTPISAEQLRSALGDERVAAIAGRLGLSSADASSALAKMLPQLIDHLTPNGELPASSELNKVLSALRSLNRKDSV